MSISHEQLASIWVILNREENLSIHICESTGRYLLESGSQKDQNRRFKSLLTYAIELTIIFDLIRSSKDFDKRHNNIERRTQHQKYVSHALTYFLQQIEPQYLRNSEDGIAYGHILLRTIMAALCALCALSSDGRKFDTSQIVSTAEALANRIPQEGDEFRFLRDISWYLIATSSSDFQGQQYCSDCPLRDATSDLDYQARSEVIERLVDLATMSSTDAIGRIKVIIEICHAYWESDAALISSCSPQSRPREVQSGLESIKLMTTALETRYLIQEHLMNANLEVSTEAGVQALTPALLSAPSMNQFCALDACECAFGTCQSYILATRKQKPKFLRHSLQKVYSAQVLGSSLLRLTEAISSSFLDRVSLDNATSDSRAASTINSGTSTNQMTMQTITAVQCNSSSEISNVTPILSSLSLEQTRPGLVSLPPYYSEPSDLHSGTSSYQANEIRRNTHHNNAVSQTPPPLSDSGGQSSEQHNRSDSIATITSSRDDDNCYALDKALIPATGHLQSQESCKIVVGISKHTSLETSFPVEKFPAEKTYPEVVVFSKASDNISLLSEASIPVTIFSTKHAASRGRWGNLLRGKKDTQSTFNVPKFRFFASGKHILLWTKHGGAILDPSDESGCAFISVREIDITHVAGGTCKYVTISRVADNYKLSMYNIGNTEKIAGLDLPRNPGAIDLSRNDQYLAIKYTRTLHLYNLHQPGTVINHKLPNHDNSQPGIGNHLVSFASDSQSFMAATRFQPERVYTYWALCAQSSTISPKVVSSTAPFGNVEDHGLTSLAVSSPTSRSCPNAFLSTFTEKGYPALVNMNYKNPTVRVLRDHKDQIGTRIHGSSLSVVDANIGRADLVLVNQNNQVFWVSDVFGMNTDIGHTTTLKRAKSLKNEIQVAVSDVDEASIFWVDKQSQKGVLVKVGKNGGKANPVSYRLDIEPLYAG